jgi:hypothetical protein
VALEDARQTLGSYGRRTRLRQYSPHVTVTVTATATATEVKRDGDGWRFPSAQARAGSNQGDVISVGGGVGRASSRRSSSACGRLHTALGHSCAEVAVGEPTYLSRIAREMGKTSVDVRDRGGSAPDPILPDALVLTRAGP